MKQKTKSRALGALLTVFLSSTAAWSGDYTITPNKGQTASITKLSDLTLGNLFSEGWGDAFVKRPHEEGAPDMTLLRVQVNMLLRSVRTDYYYERFPRRSGAADISNLNQLFEWAINRRLMLQIFGNYQWSDYRHQDDRNGPTWGALARFQLVDTEHASYALNFKVTAPNGGLEEKQTTLAASLAGWHDLAPLGLEGIGLYWHVQEETLAGPRPPGARQHDLTYDLSLAKTWHRAHTGLTNITTFLEAYARTDLDGPDPGRTAMSLTPGLRFTFANRHVFMGGIDIPLTHPRTFDEIFRLTYIYSF